MDLNILSRFSNFLPLLFAQLLYIVFPSLLLAEMQVPSGDNIALGKTYTLEPKPDYAYCTDIGDAKQLTDGHYAKQNAFPQLLQGDLWNQLPTVGWENKPMVQITFDLGRVMPISGVSFNTAAGKSGVRWPTAIEVLVSDDGLHYHLAGDLIELSSASGQPSSDGYGIHKFLTGELATHGRYVTLLVHASGPYPYIFTDEVEIFRGDPSLTSKLLQGNPITDVGEFHRQGQIRSKTLLRISSDVQAMRNVLSAAKLPTDVHKHLDAELTAISVEAGQLPASDSNTFRAVLPLNELHARIFRVQAALWRAAKNDPLAVWQTPPWDPLNLIGALPHASPPARIEARMMQGEYRAGAFNLSNTMDRDVVARLRFEKLPAILDPPWVTVHEVAWTDTKLSVPVASALPEAKREGEDFLIRIPSGMTRQVWLTFHPTVFEPGIHKGLISVRGEGFPNVDIPLQLTVSSVNFPTQPTLHLGGWDYTDAERMYGVTPTNRDALVEHLREHFVDTPWATAGVMPAVPDFRRLDAWLQRWAGARDYRVFLSVGRTFAGAQLVTKEFNEKVGSWISAYVLHLKQRGLRVNQLGVLLVDEPSGPRQDEVIIAWAKAIRAAEPEVLIWEDPVHKDPATAMEMLSACDVLCLNRQQFLGSSPSFREMYTKLRTGGKTLNFYSCSGPVNTLDPYVYHRLQAWTNWQQGATAEFFWAFGDNGGGSSWNEYAADKANYSPLFLDDRTVTPAKHMEAIREGVEDYEYFVMLRDRIGQLERAGRASSKLAAAKHLLATAADRVLNAPGADKFGWAEQKDRTAADTVRLEILDALEALGPR